jgi:S1-C subfamily serine protease
MKANLKFNIYLLIFSWMFFSKLIKADDGLLNIRKAVVQIRTTKAEPDIMQPWKISDSRNSRGSGFYIGNNMILTNAHVVAYSRYLTVRKHLSPKALPAKVAFISHDSDLAIVKLDSYDETFFSDMQPIKISGIPAHGSPVTTVGYPLGGDQISTTKGVVSRISYRTYAHSEVVSLPLIQVDSAINPGNSGGPVLQGGNAIGVAFQSLTSGQNTNYIIPTPVIEHFLKDIEDQELSGHPVLGLALDSGTLLNSDKRSYYGLDQYPEFANLGAPINALHFWSPFRDVLRVDDIILAIDDYEVGADGNIEIFGERLPLYTAFDLKNYLDPIKLKVLRDKKVLTIDTEVKKPLQFFDHRLNFDEPEYFIHSGLVFAYLNRNLLKNFKESPRLHFTYQYFHTLENFSKLHSAVVLINRLANKTNHDARYFIGEILQKIDGKDITSLAQVKAALENNKTRFATLSFWQRPEPLILDKKLLKTQHEKILQSNQITKSFLIK